MDQLVFLLKVHHHDAFALCATFQFSSQLIVFGCLKAACQLERACFTSLPWMPYCLQAKQIECSGGEAVIP